VEVADMLVPKGNVVSVVQRDGSREDFDSTLEDSSLPIVVLIDENSASASEILAGALQDREAATIVGMKSYGKGSVQVVVPLFHEDGLKLTIAKYYTPSGKCIDGIGIEPDVVVKLPEDMHEDTQLNMAREVLQKKVNE
jgi:carboxyl-terminal processing protease